MVLAHTIVVDTAAETVAMVDTVVDTAAETVVMVSELGAVDFVCSVMGPVISHESTI
jgi:hypothetical protein